MPFNFGVKVLTSAGIADSRYAFEGHGGFIRTGRNQASEWADYPVVVNAACTLSARGGCLGGTLEIAANAIQWPKLEQFQFVEFYWNRFDADSKFYRGRITRGVEREGAGNVHKYNLAGGFTALDYALIDSVHFLGTDEGAETTGTLTGCVNYILSNILDISGSTLTLSKDIIGRGDIETCDTAMKALTIHKDSKLKDLFETVEFCARGDDADDGAYWVAGVDQNGKFYWKHMTDATIALTVQHGNDHAYRPLVNWQDVVIPRLAKKRLAINGNQIQSGDNTGYYARKFKTNPYAYAHEPTTAQPHEVFAPGIDSDDDIDRWAEGWFRGFGRRTAIAKSMDYVATEPPRPWNGFVRFNKVNEAGSIEATDLFWDTAEFSLASGPVIKIAIGDEQEPRLSRNQGDALIRKMIRDYAGPFPMYTGEVSRETAPTGPVIIGGSGGTSVTGVIVSTGWGSQ